MACGELSTCTPVQRTTGRWLLTDLLILGQNGGESLTNASFCSKLDQISASPHSVCELTVQ